MSFKTIYSKQAKKFIAKNPALISREKADALLQLAFYRLSSVPNINIDLVALKGENKGKYRIRTGSIRIIFQVLFGEIVIMEVSEIGFRGDIYK